MSDILTIGEILKGHGVKGQVRIMLRGVDVTDLDRITELKAILADGSVQTLTLKKFHAVGRKLIMTLANVTDRTAADKLVGAMLTVPASQLPKRSANEPTGDLIGYGVYSTEGDRIGIVNDVLELPASDVLQVTHDGKDVLIPLIDEFVKKIDQVERRLEIFVIEGLLD